MENIFSELALIANLLDKKGHIKFADSVDGIISSALDIKVAQYVGIQGYWIRNSRCWGNCVRQKKTSDPKMASQDIWAACHKEYLSSLGSPDSTWDKYADTSEGMVKSASARVDFDKSLQKKIEAKIAAGSDTRSSIIASLDEQQGEYFGRLIEDSSSLIRIADSLTEDDLDLALRLGSAAAGLSKMARWWHPADWMGGVGDWANKNRAEYAGNLQQKAQDYMSREQGRNNPFLGGGAGSPPSPDLAGGADPASGASPTSGTKMPSGQMMAGPGISGGNFKPKSPMMNGGSAIDGDGMPAVPPTGAGGSPNGPAGASPSQGKPSVSTAPIGGGMDGTISLRPMSSLDEMSPMEAKEYFATLMGGQERINKQLMAIRNMYSPGYRKDKSWGGGEEVAPPAGAPSPASPSPQLPDWMAGAAAGAAGGQPPKPPTIPPAPPTVPGSNISAPSGAGNAGTPNGPAFTGNQNISTPNFPTQKKWTGPGNVPKPRRRV